MAHLPYDILFPIFSESTESQADPSTIIRVSGVCQRWREVAFNVPKLWCTLRLNFPPDDDTVDGPTLDSLQQKAALWLKNSNTEMLTITIEYGEHVGLILHLVSFVSSAAHRWSSIHFRGLGNVRIGEGSELAPLQPDSDGSIIVVRGESDSGYRTNQVTWTKSQRTIILPQIQISVRPSSKRYRKLPMGIFCFYTLLRIDPRSIASTWEEVVNFIASFPSLQRLDVLDGVNDADPRSPWYNPHRTLPVRPLEVTGTVTSLRELCLFGFTNANPYILLKQLISPNLKSLTIEMSVIPDGFHSYFVVRPALTSLRLRTTYISELELKGMLDSFRELETLDLGSIRDSFLSVIGPDPNSSLVKSESEDGAVVEYRLPRLTSLRVYASGENISPEAILSMATNRERASERKLALPLKHFGMLYCYLGEGCEQRLREMFGSRLALSV